MKQLGSAIKAARRNAGESQLELAARIIKSNGLPITSVYLCDIELGKKTPNRHEMLKAIAVATGLSYDWLCLLVGLIPDDIADLEYTEENAVSAWRVFRGAQSAPEKGE